MRDSNPCTGVSFFKRSGECGEKIFSPLKTANSPHSTLKDAGALRWKQNFFSPLFTGNLTLIFDQTSTRANIVERIGVKTSITQIFKFSSRFQIPFWATLVRLKYSLIKICLYCSDFVFFLFMTLYSKNAIRRRLVLIYCKQVINHIKSDNKDTHKTKGPFDFCISSMVE